MMFLVIETARNGWTLKNETTGEAFVFSLGDLDAMLAQIAKWCGRT